MWKTRVCDILGVKYPILQGGMTMAGNPELAAAISNAGALGMVGANPGWMPLEQREDNLRRAVRKTKSLTAKPFGVNMTLQAMEALAGRLIDIALEEGVKIIACSGGSPKLYTKKIKDAGAVSIHVLGNAKQAQTAEACGVDIVVGEGYEAGGFNSHDELTTFVLVHYLADAVKIPVVAAGGICDARGFLAALALGAEGVQIGTRFIVTKECHVHPKFKDAIVAAQDTDTIVIMRALGHVERSLKSEYTAKILDMDRRGAVEEEKTFIGRGRSREGQLLGDAVNGNMSAGQNAGMIKDIPSAAEVVQRIMAGIDAEVKRCLDLQKR